MCGWQTSNTEAWKEHRGNSNPCLLCGGWPIRATSGKGEGQQRLEHPSFRHRGSTESGVYDMCGQLGRPVAEQSHLKEKGSLVLARHARWGRGPAACGGHPHSLLSRTAVLLPPSERHNFAPMTSGGSLGSGQKADISSVQWPNRSHLVFLLWFQPCQESLSPST